MIDWFRAGFVQRRFVIRDKLILTEPGALFDVPACLEVEGCTIRPARDGEKPGIYEPS